MSTADNARVSLADYDRPSHSRPSLPLSDASAAADDVSLQSAATSQSDVDVSSPLLSPDSNADYSVAAGNVSDVYQRCGSHTRPFTAVHFDTPPAAIVINSDADDEQCSHHSPDSRQSVGVDSSSEKVASLQRKHDPYCSAARQDVAQNLSKTSSSDLPSSYMTSVLVAASSDSSGRYAASCCEYSPQQKTVELPDADVEAGTCPPRVHLGPSEPLESDDYSASAHAGLDSSSSDPAYARASVSVKRFPADLHGSPAPLSSQFSESDSIS